MSACGVRFISQIHGDSIAKKKKQKTPGFLKPI